MQEHAPQNNQKFVCIFICDIHYKYRCSTQSGLERVLIDACY